MWVRKTNKTKTRHRTNLTKLHFSKYKNTPKNNHADKRTHQKNNKKIKKSNNNNNNKTDQKNVNINIDRLLIFSEMSFNCWKCNYKEKKNNKRLPIFVLIIFPELNK